MLSTSDNPLLRTLRLVGVAIGAALLVYLSISITLTLTVAKPKPEVALNWWPWGGLPKAMVANRLVLKQEPSASDLDQASGLAEAALARDPLSVDAVNALALVAAHKEDEAGAARLFRASEFLSRRHLPTQIWLIEEAVRRNDIPSALSHYDRALRTSKSAADYLLPTLVAAADDPQILPALNTILAPRPDWWRQFLALAIKDVRDSRALLAIGRTLRLAMSDEAETNFVQQIIRRLIADRHYQSAYAYYADTKRLESTQAAALRDGDFSGDRSPLPFDWWFRDDYELSAGKEVFGDDPRLVLRSNASGGGEVARQLLILAPGRYTLKGVAGSTGAGVMEQPMIQVDCVEGAELIRRPLPAANEKGSAFEMRFEVPRNCGGQWLRIILAPTERSQAWIDSLQITGG
ncbi:hypothetical protein FPZ54_16670 [Sphingomonas suaedae]|uniref:Tetratricopeptide repeat protein n=1 Tax=Sphingomonas suaedae TaxID=2599297 RepID=A0A518RJ54_9SPHN|nr:hypothetical protein [Sphingomonas suaedae]QDX27474.1 hypothetical protein FPZ54_16670 [Sphingomonas suaedae]